MSTLTEGPWWPCGANRGNCVCGLIWSKAAGYAVLTVNGGSHDEQGPLTPEQRAEVTALACAAPDLLLALEELVASRDRRAGVRDRDGTDGRYARARAAIAKARGPVEPDSSANSNAQGSAATKVKP